MNKKTILGKLCIIALMLFGLVEVIYAVPGRRRVIQKELPDGTFLSIIIKGDEFRSWITTIDEYSIKQKEDGFYYYQEIDADTIRTTEIKANNPDKRKNEEILFLKQIKKNLVPMTYSDSKNAPRRAPVVVTDAGKVGWLMRDNPYRGKASLEYLVVPVSYPDKPLTLTTEDLERLCNEKSLNEWGLNGSVKDFFEDMSFGKFSVHAKVLPTYITRKEYGSYSENNIGLDSEVITYLNSKGICWNDLSKHGAPVISVIFPGFSQSETGDLKDIWANNHSYVADGKTYYASSASFIYIPEFDKYPEELPGTYTFCHEFSHALGVPDLYDTNDETGGQHFEHYDWDLMVGSSGRNAPAHNSFIRHKLGWIENAVELTEPTDVSIKDVEQEKAGYFFRAKTNGEFFWLENRQPGKWNNNLPNNGMLIYHVDSTTWVNHTEGQNSMYGWINHNQVNADASRPGFDLEEADGIKDQNTRAGDCFPGTANITSFTDNTVPNAKDYEGNPTNKPITNIQLNDGIISFDFMGGGKPLTEVFISTMQLTSSNSIEVQLDIKHGSNTPASEYGVYYGLTAISQTNKMVGNAAADNKPIVELQNLRSNIKYYICPYVIVDGKTIKGCVSAISTTLPEIVNGLPLIYDFTNAEILNSISLQANIEGYLPEIKGNALQLPLSSKVIFPMMTVAKGKEIFIRFQNTDFILNAETNPSEKNGFIPFLFYRYKYNEEWKSVKGNLALITLKAEQDQIQFALGVEAEEFYFVGGHYDYGKLSYYKRWKTYSPIITFTDKYENDWVVNQFPYIPVFEKEDYSLWGMIPSGSRYNGCSKVAGLDYSKICETGGIYNSDITLPLMNTSILSKPVLRFFYRSDGYGTGVYVKYKTNESDTWHILHEDVEDYIYSNNGNENPYRKEYCVELPKSEKLQIRISNINQTGTTGIIHNLRIGEALDLAISDAGVLEESPLVKIELASLPHYYKEYGIVINGKTHIPCIDARYSISYMLVPELDNGEEAQVKIYAITKEGTTLYSNNVTIVQPTRIITSKAPSANYIDNRGKYSTFYTGYYPGNKEILLQGLCWSSSTTTPTVELNEGLMILEASEKERLDSIIPSKSGYQYYIRPFQLCEGESVYTYGNYIRFCSGATGQEILTFPLSFEDCSQPDIEAYWNYTGSWIADGRLTTEFRPNLPLSIFQLTTPPIQCDIQERTVLQIKGQWTNLKIQLIDELTGNQYWLTEFYAKHDDHKFALPGGINKFRLRFDFENLIGHSLDIREITTSFEDSWLILAEQAEQDETGRYLIDSPRKLAWIAAKTNAEENWSKGKKFLQTCDIDLEKMKWTPIGHINSFNGHYDGSDYQIANMNIDNADFTEHLGLFGYINNATIERVHIVSGKIVGSSHIGSVVGYATYSTIRNCSNQMNLNLSDTHNNYLGGIIGYSSNNKLEYLRNSGNVNGKYFVGGIVGEVYYGMIMGCLNSGDISGTSTVGGVLGKKSGSYRHPLSGSCETYESAIVACANIGEINATTYAGGIYGALYDPCDMTQFYGSYNAGHIVAESQYGAIAGSGYPQHYSGIYYDNETLNSDLKSTLVTTIELKSQSIIDDMNLAIPFYASDYKWYVDPEGGYPKLVFYPGGVSINDDSTYEKENMKVICIPDGVIISLNNESMINIYSIEGKLIKTINGVVGDNRMELSNGIYLLRVDDEVRKIII